MKLFIATSGESKEEILENLKKAIDNGDFCDDNCITFNPDGSALDYDWVDKKGNAFLADLTHE